MSRWPRPVCGLVAGLGLALLAACGAAAPPAGAPRGAGKADSSGSCAAHCGVQAPGGPDACWCDASCAGYGDCCPDKVAACDAPPPALTPPAAPVADDPRFAVQGARRWYLVGNALTAGHDALELSVAAPPEVQLVDAWLDGAAGVRLERADGAFRYARALADLAPGEHELLLAADGAATAFARVSFFRSHPLYAVVTNDWDRADNADATLARQEQLHQRHPELRLTHFVGPYTFTEPTISAARAQQLVAWLDGLRTQHGDEIGLHIHPYCSFVAQAGVTCRSAPSFAYAQGDSTGYTVILAEYSEQELAAMLQTAGDLFVANGLPRPTSFRAGGWTAGLHTLRALAAAGYVADGSGCNWRRMEEWQGRPGAALYDWNAAQWSTIGDTSQPYYPSESALLDVAPPQLAILEVPDNGLLVDYVSAAEMIDVFAKNWPGGALAAPVAYSIGYHPPNFSEVYLQRMHGALDHVDRHLAAADAGPVVYATMSELPLVWTRTP